MKRIAIWALLCAGVSAQSFSPVQPIDFTSLATMPVHATTVAGTPSTCTANKELLIKTDATAGQQLFICNGSGNGWNLLGDGGSGGGVPSGASLPGTCSTGTVYFLTSAPAGQNLYGCTATNTYSLLGDGTAASANVCSSLVTSVSNVITIPTTCKFKIQGIVAPFSCLPSTSITTTGGSNTGTVDLVVDIAGGGTCYINHTLASVSCGAGATCVPATGAPTSSTALWIAHFTVTAGVPSAIVPKDDGQPLGSITFTGNLVETVGANGERSISGSNQETGVATTSTTSETLSSTVCGGTRAYTSTSAIAVTLPTPGTAGFALGCNFTLIKNSATSSITLTSSGATFNPSTCNTIAPNTGIHLTNDGSANWYCAPAAAGTGSGGLAAPVTFSANASPQTYTPPTGINRVFVQVWAPGAGGLGSTTGPVPGVGGSSGGYIEKWCAVTPGVGVTVTVPLGGVAGAVGGALPANPSNASFGSCATAVAGGWSSPDRGLPGYDLTLGTAGAMFFAYRPSDLSVFSSPPYGRVTGTDITRNDFYIGSRNDIGSPGGRTGTSINTGSNGSPGAYVGGGGGGGAIDFGGAVTAGGTGGTSGYGGAGGNGGSTNNGSLVACTAGTAPGGGGGGAAADSVRTAAGCAGGGGKVIVWQ